MPSSKFTVDSLPSLCGKTYVVTGGNAGIGYSTVAGLAARGARVYVGARSEVKTSEAITAIKAATPSADVRFLPLDLSSLVSVVAAARHLRRTETALHGLINNAGIMGVPFSTTEDGYEANYIAHLLLTHHLLPLLQATGAATAQMTRLVNVTSNGHERFVPPGGIAFDDLDLESRNAMIRYGQSKLANVLHAKELHRKYGPGASGAPGLASARRPFIQATSTRRNTARHARSINLNKQATGAAPSLLLRAVTPVMRCVRILDEQYKGALSSLFAIASDDFTTSDSGAYVIPYAVIGSPSIYAQDPALATKLWEWTEAQLSEMGLLQMDAVNH
ncbi:NAD(P)-binding domain protein [Cordyceps fumosorosea ARSEF 2679]|uniref:NAD(P)-binding domain protein n=1 Tax=Cordyceps fumosorosea (strain ARSEF 2679) TaxID=1081104 RepID=A0A167U7K3_CORFA|nr:NAD(P)-binding domain protein [Cordyceps fumosorosea ARSEF 2679]OAA61313.1 NAD(P)-binding domain protein [Cordyceps fumosorosea ARSEF 2679]